MKHVHHILSLCLILAIVALGLGACKGGMVKGVDQLTDKLESKIPSQNLFVAADYEKERPLSVAILPFDNLSAEPQAADLVRRLFYNNFSSLAYQDIELARITATLADFDPKASFDKPDATTLGKRLGADALIFGRITKFETLYAVAYSSFTVGMELKMIDAQTNEILWSVKHEEVQRSGSIPMSPIGAIVAAASTAMDLSRYNIVNTSNKLCLAAVDTLPPSANLKGKSFPRITNLVHDGVNRVLKKGDRLQVGIEGTPGLTASFIIPPLKTPVSMTEKEPGSYIGTYIVKPDDTLSDGQIVVSLTDSWSNVCRWEDTLGFVNLDGVPPEPPTGIKATAGSQKITLHWNPSEAKDLVGYQVLRSATPLTGYQQIAKTEYTHYEDNQLTNFTPYFYRIMAVDRAGNLSQVQAGIGATPVPPGPTPVSGNLADETDWYPGANPYRLSGAVTVAGGGLLRIHPGVVITAEKGSRLIVHGRLEAAGEKNAPLIFSTAEAGQRWGGIFFERSEDKSQLTNFELQDAEVGLKILDASPQILSGTVKSCVTGLSIEGDKAAAVLDDLTVYRNQANGIEIRDLAKPRITRCRIAHNGETGLLIVRSQPSALENEISYNRQGVFIDQASALVAANQILYNHQNALWAQETNLSALKIDLNYFGPPAEVHVFSSHPEQKSGHLAILETPDHRGGRKILPLAAFPDGPPKTELSLMVTASGPAGEVAKAETTPPATAGPKLPAEVKPAPVEAKTPPSAAASAAKPQSQAKPALDAFIEGVSATRKEDYPKAIGLFNAALAESSREAEARFWLGYCYLQTGELKKAVFNYNKAAQLAPDNNEYLLHLGTALHLSGQTAKAKIVYEEVLRRDPKNADALEFLKLLKEAGS